jgi:hypothetical protein
VFFFLRGKISLALNFVHQMPDSIKKFNKKEGDCGGISFYQGAFSYTTTGL